MRERKRNWRSIQVLLALVFCSYLATAQDVGLLTSVKGTVVLKKASGESHRASVKEGVSVGDEVSTSNDASATIMYYTGKEVYLSANKKYVIAKEGKQDSFWNRLTTVFSNLLWSKGPSKSVLGASRGLDTAANRIRGIYPSHAVYRDTVLKFEWRDTQSKPGMRYEVTVRNDIGNIVTSATVAGSNTVLVLIVGLKQTADVQYRWQVRDLKSGLTSKETMFAFLSDAEKERFAEAMQRIRDECKDDASGTRMALLEALLYIDFNLVMQAEASLTKLVKQNPDFAVGHELLADVYMKAGKIEDALAEQKVVRSLEKK